MIAIGALINAAAILAGGAIGLLWIKPLSPLAQARFKIGLGLATVIMGLAITWTGLSGSFLQVLKQLLIVVLAMGLGKGIGRLLRLQKLSNAVGRYARQRMAMASPGRAALWNEGFMVGTLLFCAAPLAMFGAVQEGLTGNFLPLTIKAVMDGLAAMAFAAMFRWGIMMAALPVLAWEGFLTLIVMLLGPFLAEHNLTQSITATNGLLIFSVSLVILELKKIELTDYLPSLAVAPLITWLWG
jgi:uncharacterized protein